MIRLNVHRFGTIRTFVLVGLLAIGLASTATRALSQTSGTWSNTGSMNTARQNHAATLLQNGQVLVAGGQNGTGILAGAELYTPSKGKWTATGSMNTARMSQTATLLQTGQVLVIGGANSTNNNLSSAELYNPASGTWSVTSSMSTGRGLCTAILLPNGRVLVAGGVDSNGVVLSSAELYDPSTGTWAATGRMNLARFGHTATLLPNGLVLVVGGTTNGSLTTELYNPVTGTWALTGSMIYGRFRAFAMLLSDGQVLVLDGGVSFAEFYNPSTGTWCTDGSGNTQAGDTGQTVTLLGTGMVLTAGGTEGVYPRPITVLTRCDLFDPSTGNDVLTGSMHKPRDSHTATLIQDGRVLAAGGESQDQKGNLFYTNTAELYKP